MSRAYSTASLNCRGVYRSNSRSTRMNSPSAVPPVGRFQPPPQQGEARGQLPVLQRLGVVEAARLPLQQGQIVNRVVKILLFSPTSRMAGHQPVIVNEPTSSTVATTVIWRWAYFTGTL